MDKEGLNSAIQGILNGEFLTGEMLENKKIIKELCNIARYGITNYSLITVQQDLKGLKMVLIPNRKYKDVIIDKIIAKTTLKEALKIIITRQKLGFSAWD